MKEFSSFSQCIINRDFAWWSGTNAALYVYENEMKFKGEAWKAWKMDFFCKNLSFFLQVNGHDTAASTFTFKLKCLYELFIRIYKLNFFRWYLLHRCFCNKEFRLPADFKFTSFSSSLILRYFFVYPVWIFNGRQREERRKCINFSCTPLMHVQCYGKLIKKDNVLTTSSSAAVNLIALWVASWWRGYAVVGSKNLVYYLSI